MDRRRLGRWGEEIAANFLKEKDFSIATMNYTTRFGEIDIIAVDGEYIVFVEVKLRKNDKFAKAREFVTKQKQERIKISAEIYLQNSATKLQPRFDVIEVYASEWQGESGAKIYHYENAFM